jgi:hypothetical protein
LKKNKGLIPIPAVMMISAVEQYDRLKKEIRIDASMAVSGNGKF